MTTKFGHREASGQEISLRYNFFSLLHKGPLRYHTTM